jgi:hypothetical protein
LSSLALDGSGAPRKFFADRGSPHGDLSVR